MFKQQVTKLTDNQLKKRHGFCLGIAIGFLIGMVIILIYSLNQISGQNDFATYTALAPAIFMPLIIVPLTYSSALNSEIKQRNKAEYWLKSCTISNLLNHILLLNPLSFA